MDTDQPSLVAVELSLDSSNVHNAAVRILCRPEALTGGVPQGQHGLDDSHGILRHRSVEFGDMSGAKITSRKLCTPPGYVT